MTQIWLVGIWKGSPKSGIYSIIGAFDSEELARAACRTDNHFVGPLEVNADLGDDRDLWPGQYYPSDETAEQCDKRRAKDTTL